MKHAINALILSLPFLSGTALAQQAPGRQPQQMPEFSEVKARMLPMMAESLDPMTKTRDCIAASQNSDQLNGCVSIMADYQEKMMTRMGRPADGQQPPQPPKLEWSEELKGRILTDIELSIKNTLATKGCLDSSTNHEQMSQCMQAAGLSRPPQQ